MHLIGNSPLRVLAIILLVEVEAGEGGKGAGGHALLLALGGVPAVLLVEVGAADRAEALAVLATQNHEGGLHHQGREERVGEVDGVVLRDEGELHVVVLAFNVLGLLEEVVLVHLGGDVELGVLQAAVTGALDVGAQDAAGQDALARVGEGDVEVDALRQVKSWPSV